MAHTAPCGAKVRKQQRRRGALAAAVAGVAGVQALSSAAQLSFAATGSCAGTAPLAGSRNTRFGGVTSHGASRTSSRLARKADPAAVAAAAPLLGIFDIAKVANDPGTPTLLAQCAAAISLVVAGNFAIGKEEEDHKEKEKKKSDLKAAKEAVGVTVKEEEEEYDIWRESLLRYLGYSNELGEALRPVLPAAYLASYVAAFSYVLADSVDKGMRADKKAKLASVRKAFLSFDKNADGALSQEEVKAAFADLKVPLSDNKVKACFDKMDSTKNQEIEIEEFMAAYDRADQEIADLVEAFRKEDQKGASFNPLENPALVAGGDALIWQTIASVALPGFTINRFVTLAEQACEGQAAGNPVAEYFPTVLGLSMIPLICKPLDVLADLGLDATLRPLLFSAIDSDKSGTIEFSELKAKMENVDPKYDEKYLRQLFDELDIEKNGVITIEEWRTGGYKKFKDLLHAKLA